MSLRVKQRVSAAKRIKRLLAAPFVFLAAVIILLEDWLWDDLARLAAVLGRLPIFRQIEAFIVRLPSYWALAFFAVPSTLLIPVKVVALYFVAHGHALAGLLTVAAAKVAGTALVARLFTLTRPNLLRIGSDSVRNKLLSIVCTRNIWFITSRDNKGSTCSSRSLKTSYLIRNWLCGTAT